MAGCQWDDDWETGEEGVLGMSASRIRGRIREVVSVAVNLDGVGDRVGGTDGWVLLSKLVVYEGDDVGDSTMEGDPDWIGLGKGVTQCASNEGLALKGGLDLVVRGDAEDAFMVDVCQGNDLRAGDGEGTVVWIVGDPLHHWVVRRVWRGLLDGEHGVGVVATGGTTRLWVRSWSMMARWRSGL